MPGTNDRLLGDEIIRKALEFGADVAGIAAVPELKQSPSHQLYPKLPEYTGVGSLGAGQLKQGEVTWPEKAQSCLVIGLNHLKDKPELDWWQEGLKGGTKGNQILISITSRLGTWLREEKKVMVHPLPYHLEKGGIFLKDAAVLAGLGCLGRNNLFVSRTVGPRIRLRALLLDHPLDPTGPLDFDPCAECPAPCRTACPTEAFLNQTCREQKSQIDGLPARDGYFDRLLCNRQMETDSGQAEKIAAGNGRQKVIAFCRRCEFACPAGLQEAP